MFPLNLIIKDIWLYLEDVDIIHFKLTNQKFNKISNPYLSIPHLLYNGLFNNDENSKQIMIEAIRDYNYLQHEYVSDLANVLDNFLCRHYRQNKLKLVLQQKITHYIPLLLSSIWNNNPPRFKSYKHKFTNFRKYFVMYRLTPVLVRKIKQESPNILALIY